MNKEQGTSESGAATPVNVGAAGGVAAVSATAVPFQLHAPGTPGVTTTTTTATTTTSSSSIAASAPPGETEEKEDDGDDDDDLDDDDTVPERGRARTAARSMPSSGSFFQQALRGDRRGHKRGRRRR